jgi:hypothetical protein
MQTELWPTSKYFSLCGARAIFGTALYSACEFVCPFVNVLHVQDRLLSKLYLWFYASNKDKNTTVRISVKTCIYGWKIDFIIDFYSCDLWPLKDKPLKIILHVFRIPFFEERFLSNFFFRTFSFLFGLSRLTFDWHLLRLISGFMPPIRTKIPPFDSA